MQRELFFRRIRVKRISIKRVLLLCLLSAGNIFTTLYAQENTADSIAAEKKQLPVAQLSAEYGHNKTLPPEYTTQVLTALSHFPELVNVKIKYIVKATYTPLSTKPDFWSMFKRKSRRGYIITLSNKTIDTLRPLLYQNLDFVQQVGIMGHELSHVVDFRSKNALQSLRNAIGHLFPRFIDKMEYHTDSICINHGLGKQLKSYSTHVRTAMHVHFWRGVDYVMQKNDKYERYMNPDTIERYTRAFEAKH